MAFVLGVRCPMRRYVSIDPARLFDPRISKLPLDVWAIVFLYIRPSERIHLMWTMATRIPPFAYIFSCEPQLWMDWPIRTGGSDAQSLEVLFAITLWCEWYDRGRAIPISVHAAGPGAITLSDIISLLPPTCLPYIHGMSLRTSRYSYVHHDISTFLFHMSGLKHLTLSVKGQCDGPFGGGSALFPQNPTMQLPEVSITSLCFHDIFIVPTSALVNQWAHLTALHLVYYREVTTIASPLYDILFAASNIRELYVHVASSLYSASRDLFKVPLYTRRSTWKSRLAVVDLQGDRLHVSAFVESLLFHPGVTLGSIHLTYNCDLRIRDKFFAEVPAFLNALRHWSGPVAVHANRMVVSLGDSHDAGGVRKWIVRWKLYDKWNPRWPAGHFSSLENTFRLLISRTVATHPPDDLTILSYGPITSIFASMLTPCHIRRLHLHGDTSMYEPMLHYILQHSTLFPLLNEICLHRCSSDNSTHYPHIYSIATTFGVPLTPPSSRRRILITANIGTRDPLGWSATFVQLVWELTSPKESFPVIT